MSGGLYRQTTLHGPATTSTIEPARFIEVGQGEHRISKDPRVMLTATLGSCVAVILIDRIGRQCGITHIFQCVGPGPTGGAAVIAEIEKLVNALMRAGSPRASLEARLVGGAHTLGRGRDVGGDISRVCLSYLQAEHIPLTSSDLGGKRPRRIKLSVTTGNFQVSNPGFSLPDTVPPVRHPAQEDTELF